MLKKKVCIIGQFAPPMHGLSKALDTIYNSNISNDFDLEKVNLTNNKKLFRNLITIFRSNAELFYFTISQTKIGNIRDLIILKLLELQNKKCIIHLHGGYYRQLVDNDLGRLQKKWNYKAISKLNGVIVLSNSLKYIFEGMIESKKIHVIQNCIDDELLMSDENFENKLNKLKDKDIINILYLSNFIKSKGYEKVLELARIEKENCINNKSLKRMHFNFAGKFFKKEEEEYFFKYIKENELEDYVTYHGVVSGRKKNELLNNNDIFILLTKYKKEGQPISILEAMGNGMVVISTDHAGIPDIVKTNENGYISLSLDIKDIYLWIFKNKNRFQQIMNINRDVIKKKYMQDVYIKSIREVFKNI